MLTPADSWSHLRPALVGAALLGAALLACGSSRKKEDANTIVVFGDVNHEALHALQRARGRNLTRAEMLELHGVWIDNEVLYREGQKLSPLPGAAPSREQIIARALAAIDRKVRSSSVSDEELRRWFEARRDDYAQPTRFDFEDAALPGPPTESTVRALAGALNGNASADPRVSFRTFKGRPESNLVQSYGENVALALAQAEPGKWLPLPTRDGWRAVRLIALTRGRHATFDGAREAIRRDFVEAAAVGKRAAAVRALWKDYEIVLEETIECLADQG